MTHLAPDLLAFLERWLPPPPIRVLEVGCGDGTLTRELIDRGFRVTGIDPEAPDGEPFVRNTLEEFETEVPFDAAVAIRSLHHVGELTAAVASLAAALRPGARLVVSEFAVESYDEQAARWLEAAGLSDDLDMHFDGVIPLAEVRHALATRFDELAAAPAPTSPARPAARTYTSASAKRSREARSSRWAPASSTSSAPPPTADPDGTAAVLPCARLRSTNQDGG